MQGMRIKSHRNQFVRNTLRQGQDARFPQNAPRSPFSKPVKAAPVAAAAQRPKAKAQPKAAARPKAARKRVVARRKKR